MEKIMNRKVRRANRALHRANLRKAVYDEFKDKTDEYRKLYPEYSIRSKLLKSYRNSLYSIRIYEHNENFKKVAIQRHDNIEIGDWDTIQRIKNDIFGKETWAFEMYPRESDLQNVANIRWIFIGDGEPIANLEARLIMEKNG